VGRPYCGSLFRVSCASRYLLSAAELLLVFFFSSRRRHTRLVSDWSSDVCSSDLPNGDYDPRTRLEVARAGYLCAVTTEVGLNNERDDLLALRRIHGEYDLARFVKNTSGFETWRGKK